MKSKILCPYCEQLIQEYSRDHIFPEFLGGSRTIAACKPCNEIFGNTFEGRAAAMLYGMQVSMSTWGLSFRQTAPRWRRALKHQGIEFDISVEGTEPKLTLSRPIKEVRKDGTLSAISFGNAKEAVRTLRNARKKGYDNAVLETVALEMPSPSIPFRFELNQHVLRTALKMCYALSTLLPQFDPNEVAHARSILKFDPHRMHVNVIPAFETYESLDDMHEPLSHLVYVERDESRLYGVVRFFGVLQVFCGLGRVDRKSEPGAALMGILDPITGKEKFSDAPSLSLPIPSFTGEEGLSHANNSWFQKFKESAVARGATKPINLVGTASYKAVS